MTRSAYGRYGRYGRYGPFGTFGVVTVVLLLCTLAACGDEGAGGPVPEEERPCPSSSGTPAAAEPPGDPTPSVSPGDSRTHAVDPRRDCLIESGVPDMPVDP
ncbi:hypothetical protein [Streptomyces sp. NPDC051921]|uniref:hypothetical protein n=1 Tax=Streptomyces sp. NPDC051921 TaxID=3155806 RepID=UPI0034180F44